MRLLFLNSSSTFPSPTFPLGRVEEKKESRRGRVEERKCATYKQYTIQCDQATNVHAVGSTLPKMKKKLHLKIFLIKIKILLIRSGTLIEL
ncbi:hypothetical protein BpHYR1_002036 [Brachionus plicatilis]|uniref:Uncharacterized protein n=1 Tax=Brachionus plicatilis TaxID=10195 RepID=A0A3M7PYH6_BRAPC|nr:hypothetical protein BpHYR1_002036 [Brachionus plicatilis]